MESLQLKNVIFNPTEVVLLKKKGNISISIDDIKRIEYTKPTFFNYLVRTLYPGYLQIFLNNKPFKSYLVKIKYEDVLKLPEFYLQKIDAI